MTTLYTQGRQIRGYLNDFMLCAMMQWLPGSVLCPGSLLIHPIVMLLIHLIPLLRADIDTSLWAQPVMTYVCICKGC